MKNRRLSLKIIFLLLWIFITDVPLHLCAHTSEIGKNEQQGSAKRGMLTTKKKKDYSVRKKAITVGVVLSAVMSSFLLYRACRPLRLQDTPKDAKEKKVRESEISCTMNDLLNCINSNISDVTASSSRYSYAKQWENFVVKINKAAKNRFWSDAKVYQKRKLLSAAIQIPPGVARKKALIDDRTRMTQLLLNKGCLSQEDDKEENLCFSLAHYLIKRQRVWKKIETILTTNSQLPNVLSDLVKSYTYIQDPFDKNFTHLVAAEMLEYHSPDIVSYLLEHDERAKACESQETTPPTAVHMLIDFFHAGAPFYTPLYLNRSITLERFKQEIRFRSLLENNNVLPSQLQIFPYKQGTYPEITTDAELRQYICECLGRTNYFRIKFAS